MKRLAFGIFAIALACCTVANAQTLQPNAYPTMAPVAKYLMPRAAEVEMARSAAPASISAHATVLVMTKTGYVTAAKGTNRWVCLVERMWSAGLDDPEFWNPKGRGAACLNPQAVRSVLAFYVARAKWALAGDTRDEIAKKSKAGYADHQFAQPAGFALMLSKESYLNDGVAGPWRPHIMPFVAKDQLATWAAGFKGSPIMSPATATFRAYEPVTVVILAPYWSDGSPAPPLK
ncbi:MAG TPA: hypothetical protein VFN49_12445 [Candidatus Aquilonibacter sp.]|nr:hypothetical protein [Candidatus Aquilonibacter sp.]